MAHRCNRIQYCALVERDDETVKVLGERLFLDSGTLTPLLKKLETQGLITRERSHEDERNVIVRLTDRGRALKVQAAGVPAKVAKCVNLPALSDWFLSLLAPNCPLQRSLIGWLANPRQPRAGTSMSVNGTCADWC